MNQPLGARATSAFGITISIELLFLTGSQHHSERRLVSSVGNEALLYDSKKPSN